MKIKLTGAEWKAFYKDDTVWDAGVWHEDEVMTLNGEEISDEDFDLDEGIKDTGVVTVEDGRMIWDDTDKVENMVTMIRRWKKAQSTETFVAQVPKGRVKEFKALMKEHGFKI